MTVTDRNRLIADPYPRFVVARDQVNQGAAVLLTSVEAGRAAGVPQSRWVFLRGYADLCERPVLERPDLSRGPASVEAARSALERAGVSPAEVAYLDLYSGFAAPVFNICDGLGIRPDDPRGLTVTGGLPFFGGPGNNYSMHAIAEMVDVVRREPGTLGLVGANGGVMSKYSAAVYSTQAAPFEAWSDLDARAALDAAERVAVRERFSGQATVETYTVTANAERDPVGIVVGRLADGSRTLAVTRPDDRASLTFLGSAEPLGATVTVLSRGDRNVVGGFAT